MLAGISHAVVKSAPKSLVRNISHTPGPALNPLSTAETIGYGVFMFTAWVSYPAWVLVNIKKWNHKE